MESQLKYPPSEFHNKNISEFVEIVSVTKFSTILALQHDMNAVFAPLYITKKLQSRLLNNQETQIVLLGHLHLQSPFKALLDKSPVKCRVIFNCADCYISPTVYKKKELTGEVVPTWNYVAAQLKGEMKLVNDKQEFRQLLEEEVDQFESATGSEWRLKDAPQPYRQNMMNGIFGVIITISDFSVHKKLHQKSTPRSEVEKVTEWVANYKEPKRLLGPWMEAYLNSMPK